MLSKSLAPARAGAILFSQPGPYLALAFGHFTPLGLVPLLLLHRLVNVLAMALFPLAN
ncbi:MAG: hypothetical protein ACHQQS_14100 [Thermoanaerobaculales bacterium]